MEKAGHRYVAVIQHHHENVHVDTGDGMTEQTKMKGQSHPTPLEKVSTITERARTCAIGGGTGGLERHLNKDEVLS